MSRPTRILVVLFLCIAIPALYFFVPSSNPSEKNPQRPTDPYDHYEAGGIDSPHYRAPVKPDFEVEEARWTDAENAESQDVEVGGDDGDVCTGTGCDGPEEVSAANGWTKMGDLLSADAKGPARQDTAQGEAPKSKGKAFVVDQHEVDSVIGGGVIMPKLANETAKAELGRAAWRVLHLMTLRFPEKPTPDDRTALKSYMHLFSRLYPCGECATEFQALLKQYPPQTSSRKSASQWLCHVHNLVNERLGKPEFDCLTLDETYDCGCGDDPVNGAETGKSKSHSESSPTAPRRKGSKVPAAKSETTSNEHYDEDVPEARSGTGEDQNGVEVPTGADQDAEGGKADRIPEGDDLE